MDIWTFGQLMVILGNWSYNTYFRLHQGYPAADVNLGEMIDVQFLADIWIFGQLMVILGK